jgi:integrase/recombinase XerC
LNIQSFIDFIQQEKRYSTHTIQSYTKDLEQFQVFCRLQYQLDDIDHVNYQVVRSWIVHLMNEKITPKSVNRKISTLRSYYKFCLKKQLIKNNPVYGIQGPKTPKRNPVFIPESQMNTLFDQLQFPDSFEGMRDKMILELFYFTGMRKAELMGLKVNDIDFYQGTIKVLGKRNKERLIPAVPVLLHSIKSYLEARSKVEYAKHTELLFFSNKGNSFYPTQIYQLVKKYLGAVTTVEKKGPHVLRHTFATHMLNNGADINGIKEILGHSSLAATQVYTHNSFEKLKGIHKKAHPKG